jgi:hypothetical protein
MHNCILFSVMLLLVNVRNSIQFSVRSLKLLEFDVQAVKLVVLCKCYAFVKR